MAQTRHCPHCGTEAGELQEFCLHCGHSLPGVWPPPPALGAPQLPLSPKTLTGRAWMDFLLGAGVQYLTHFVTARILVGNMPTTSGSRDWIERAGVPGSFVLCELFWAGVFGLIGHLALRYVYPAVARGSGYATLALLAVLLGAFFTCQAVTY